MDEVSKSGRDFRMCLNLSYHQLKIDYYKHRFVYTKYNQKFTTDIKEIKGKESKHNTTESHQHTREQSKRMIQKPRTTRAIK